MRKILILSRRVVKPRLGGQIQGDQQPRQDDPMSTAPSSAHRRHDLIILGLGTFGASFARRPGLGAAPRRTTSVGTLCSGCCVSGPRGRDLPLYGNWNGTTCIAVSPVGGTGASASARHGGCGCPRQIQTRTEDGDRRLHGGLCSRAKAWMADIPAEHWLADQGYDTLWRELWARLSH